MKRREAVEKAACPNLKAKLAPVPTAPGTSSFIAIPYQNVRDIYSLQNFNWSMKTRVITATAIAFPVEQAYHHHHHHHTTQHTQFSIVAAGNWNFRIWTYVHVVRISLWLQLSQAPPRLHDLNNFNSPWNWSWLDIGPFPLVPFSFLLLVFPFKNRTTCNFNSVRQTAQRMVDRQVESRTTILYRDGYEFLRRLYNA